MSGNSAAAEDPCQGEKDLLGALQARIDEWRAENKDKKRDPAEANDEGSR